VPTATNCPRSRSAYAPLAPVTRTAGGITGTVQGFAPSAALIAAGGSGRYRTNFDGYSNEFKGLELTMNKRMSNKWGGKIAFSLNDWTESWSGTPIGSNGNPTKTDTASPPWRLVSILRAVPARLRSTRRSSGRST
jgi:hypothetical protein